MHTFIYKYIYTYIYKYIYIHIHIYTPATPTINTSILYIHHITSNATGRSIRSQGCS